MNHFYEFGSLKLDATDRLLYRNGVELPLQPRLIETLIALLETPNTVVDRDSLINTVWGETIVEEGGLKRNISILRKALGQEGQFIETLPKRGYRFSAEVKESWEESSPYAPGIIATELVVERRANLLITHEEEISQSEDPTKSDYALATPKMIPVSRTARLGLLAAAAVVLLLAVTFTYLLATGKIGKASSTATVRSIAVLPFEDLGGRGDDEHLGMGLADVLITRLSNLKAMNVRPTSAVLKYDQQEQDSIAAGRTLGVDAVLEGSIQRSYDRIRVTARLVRVSDQSPIWAGQFDEEAKDLLAVQDRISEQVAASVAVNLSGSEKAALTKRYTESVDAYRLYIKGRYHWNKRNWEGMIQAQYFFRQAIERDPNFALAHVGLADTLLTASASSEALGAINKALELDDRLGEAYAARGFFSMFHEWDWQKAEENLKQAIELRPGYGTAHQWYATLLAIEGRPVEAKLEMRRALEIDPLSHNFLADLGQMHYFAREYQEAEGYCRKALEVSPDFMFAHQYLFDVYAKTGRHDEAVEAFLKANKINTSFSIYANDRAAADQAVYEEAYRQSGIKGLLRHIVNRNLRGPGTGVCYQLAKSYALLGEKEPALDWLEKALENREFLLPFVNADPIFDDLRPELRYQAILRRMGLAS